MMSGGKKHQDRKLNEKNEYEMERFTMARKKEEVLMKTKSEVNALEKEKSAIDLLLETCTNKVFAIDCGKNNMKIIHNNKAYIYSNKIDTKFGDSLNDLTWNVEYKGEQYYVGDGATGSDLDEGKASLLHRVQALTAIAHYLNPEEKNDDIVLVYGESITFYFNEENKKDIVKGLEGKHSMIIDDVEYNFEIKKVHILPEGYGYIINNLEECLRNKYYIIDFGGRTINFLTVNNGSPVEKSSYSSEMGMYDLVAKCVTSIKQAGLGEKEDNNVECYIKYGTSQEIQDVIDATLLEHLDDFDKYMRKRKIDIHNLVKSDKVVWIGGGAQKFRNLIMKHYNDRVIVPEKALLSNVQGFYVYGLTKFGRMEF